MNRHNLAYYFKEGFNGVFSHGFMSFASVSVMLVCLLLTGTMLLLVMSLNETISSMTELGDIRVYVDETYTEEEAKAIENNIYALDNVAKLEFVSNTAALDELKDEFGDDSYLLDGLEYDNPLRHSFHVWVLDIDKYAETVSALGRVHGIADVTSSQESVDKLTQIRNVLSTASAAFMILLGAVAIFIISNTIKLATFDRREEIAIMKMIGATNGFIRAPFVIESIILSQIAALAAFGLQWLIYNYLSTSVITSIQLIKIADFYAYRFYFLGGFMAVALVLGVAGSLTSIGKYLKV